MLAALELTDVSKGVSAVSLGASSLPLRSSPLILLTLDAWKHKQFEELAEEG